MAQFRIFGLKPHPPCTLSNGHINHHHQLTIRNQHTPSIASHPLFQWHNHNQAMGLGFVFVRQTPPRACDQTGAPTNTTTSIPTLNQFSSLPPQSISTHAPKTKPPPFWFPALAPQRKFFPFCFP